MPAPAPDTPDAVEAVRRFNRFYTRQIGLLQEGLLQSPYSLTEARVLYELAHQEETTASHLAEVLELDAGYMSRVLRSFEDRGLVEKRRSPRDGRRWLLTLTDEGQEVFGGLNAASQREIRRMLSALDEVDQERLVHAMDTVGRLLGARPERRVPYILRPHQSGDMGWVVHRHGVLYNQEYGFQEEFEAEVAEIVARFVRSFDRRKERCWIAEREGRRVGSVFLVRDGEQEEVARLRCLLVEPTARGLGIGRRLVQECTRFARQAGYATITLWTLDMLESARRLYRQEGYRKVHEESRDGFGAGHVSETWELEL